MEITLEELLGSRDARHAMQERLMQEHPDKTLVCLTVVMPGSIKRNEQSLVVAKAAVEAMTRCAALYCGEQKLAIRVNAVAPGYIITPMAVQDAEELGKTVLEAFPDSDMANEYRALAKAVLNACGRGDLC